MQSVSCAFCFDLNDVNSSLFQDLSGVVEMCMYAWAAINSVGLSCLVRDPTVFGFGWS